jgi:hypothetical protein
MASTGETDGLGSDATGAIEYFERPAGESSGEQTIESCSLPGDGTLPVLEYQVVMLGELIVEAFDGRIHTIRLRRENAETNCAQLV